MNEESDFRAATELMFRYLEGLASPEEAKRLSALMRQSRPLRRHCTQMLKQHLQLFEIAEEETQQRLELQSGPERKILALPVVWRERVTQWRWCLGGLAAAAAILIFLSVSGVLSSKPRGVSAGVELAIKTTENLVLAQGQPALSVGQAVKVRRLAIESGSVSFRVTSGVNIVASGPAEFEFLDAMRMRLVHGQLTAEVEPQGRGFTVATAHGKIVDLGTRFGVDVAHSAGADVVVFQGQVEVHQTGEVAGALPLVSLAGGEAVRLAGAGAAARIGSVVTGPGPNDWSARGKSAAVIVAVTDNNTGRYSHKFYPILRRGMAEGVFAWPYEVNQPRWWSRDAVSLPDWLAGADVVQTLNQEVNNRDLRITVRLAQPCALYVFYEDGASPPDWLVRDFSDSGEVILLSPDSPSIPGDPGARGSYQKAFRVWQRTVAEPGEYELGPVLKSNVHTSPFYMYGIAARALIAEHSRGY